MIRPSAAVASVLLVGAVLLCSVVLLAVFTMTSRLVVAVSVTVVVTMAGLLLLRPLAGPLVRILERSFLVSGYDTEQILTDLAATVRRAAVSPRDLLQVLASSISSALQTRTLAIFLRTPADVFLGQSCAAQGYDNGYVCCFLCQGSTRHPSSQGSEADDTGEPLFLAHATPLVQYLLRVDAAAPQTVELFPGHPELLRPPAGAPEEAAVLRQQQRQVLRQLQPRLLVPLATSREILGFISLGEKLSGQAYRRRDRDLLLGIADQAVVALDYAQLIVGVAGQERLQHEIFLAGQVQEQLLPDHPPVLIGYQVQQLMLPAREVAGDFFQYYPGDEGTLSLVIGDVTGKGLHAAMLAALALGALEAIVQETRDPGEVLTRLNQTLFRHLGRGQFITCIFAHLDGQRGTLTFANGGHPYPSLRAGTAGPWTELSGPPPRLPLGVRGQLRYRPVDLHLEPGAALLFMSDGVVEATNSEGEQLGFDRLQEILESSASLGHEGLGLESSDLPSHVVEAIHRHSGDAAQQDDISLVALIREA